MNEWNAFLLVSALTVVVICVAVMLFERRKTRNTLKTVSQMLDRAIDGSFTENAFDESLLSAMESRLNHYLTAAALSERNLVAEKEKIKELLSDISHQTKTPLSNILLYTELLEEQKLSQEGRVCAEALRGQTEKLSFLIASLVKLSRLETGVIALHPVCHAVQTMVEQTVKLHAPKAAQKGVALMVHRAKASAVFDDKWTAEALGNLVDNAVKYTPAGGSVEISVKEYELFLRIDVADTGIGIAENEQAKVFSRFYRSPRVSEQEGVGIGLYLARQILAAQGGYIKVTSSLGSGTIFSLFLPR